MTTRIPFDDTFEIRARRYQAAADAWDPEVFWK